MTARMARMGDCDEIQALAKEAHRRSIYANLPFNEAQAKSAIQRHVGMGFPPSLGATAIFVAGHGRIEAALAAVCMPLYESLGALLITDAFWFSSKTASARSGLQVLEAFHDWAAKCSGPHVIRQGVTDFIAADPERVGCALQRRGMRRAGLIYEKECLT